MIIRELAHGFIYKHGNDLDIGGVVRGLDQSALGDADTPASDGKLPR